MAKTKAKRGQTQSLKMPKDKNAFEALLSQGDFTTNLLTDSTYQQMGVFVAVLGIILLVVDALSKLQGAWAGDPSASSSAIHSMVLIYTLIWILLELIPFIPAQGLIYAKMRHKFVHKQFKIASSTRAVKKLDAYISKLLSQNDPLDSSNSKRMSLSIWGGIFLFFVIAITYNSNILVDGFVSGFFIILLMFLSYTKILERSLIREPR
ncbi:MAG: hypothetical protein WC861_00190 [Candidatus Micrarchaeia archaeon]|jgi:hypothetical protein